MKTPKAETLDRARTTPVQRALAVSPDAAWVAWSWFGLQEAGDVHVAPTDGERPPNSSRTLSPRRQREETG